VATSEQTGQLGLAEYLAATLRLVLLGGAAIAAMGVAGRFLQWPLLSATLGPTIYVFMAHPRSESARLRSAVVGHATAVAAGLFSVAVFGLWNHPASNMAGHVTLHQAGASAVALGITLAVLHLAQAHHAPAGATALLVATGIAHPGRPLFGLMIGVGAVVALGPALGRFPLGRTGLAEEEQQ